MAYAKGTGNGNGKHNKVWRVTTAKYADVLHKQDRAAQEHAHKECKLLSRAAQEGIEELVVWQALCRLRGNHGI